MTLSQHPNPNPNTPSPNPNIQMTMSKTKSLLGELQSRPSEFAALAAKGKLQYLYSKEIMRRVTGTKEKAGVVGEAELSAGQFELMKTHLQDSFGKAAAKKGTPKPKETLTPEQKAIKEAMSNKKNVTSKLKMLIDKITNEIGGVTKKLPGLAPKYPEQMIDWCKARLKIMTDILAEHQKVYIDSVMLTDNLQEDSLAAIKDKTKSLDATLSALDKAFEIFKKQELAEVKKLL